ncbi:MAG: hypothetical protein ACREFC_04545 [Stellaceae bacterium]
MGERGGILTPARRAILLLIVAQIAVKIHLIVGLLSPDPMLLYGGISSHLVQGWLSGWPRYPTIDPNIAFTSHALGHRAALDLLSGTLPWWNYFEGVGMPLAGEMQSAAFFPPNVLLAIPGGQLYFHLTLQIVAGISTFCLMRRLGCSPIGALAAGALFEFNGTFAWLANAVVNPIPLLPVTVLGVEASYERIANRERGGWRWIAAGVALSVYSGFPEVAYLDGLLIATWTVLRAGTLPGRQRVAFLIRVATGLAVGLLIAAPILIAFVDYLAVGWVGIHAGQILTGWHLAATHLMNLFLPYVNGPIFETANFDNFGFWSNVGGYAGIAIVSLAVWSLFGNRFGSLRVMLAAWIVIAWAITFGFPGAGDLVSMIPGGGNVVTYRYLAPSWEFALAVLAALAIDDQSRSPDRRSSYWLSIGVTVALCCGAFAFAAVHLIHTVTLVWGIVSAAIGGGAIFALLLLGLRAMSGRVRAVLLTTLALAEAIVFFVLPTLSYPRAGRVDFVPIQYLQVHLGNQRFLTLGPIEPNYGSYFGIAELNYDDLPVPRDWTDFVTRRLDDNVRAPELFLATARARKGGPSAAENFVGNEPNFLSIGTRYVVTSARFNADIFTQLSPAPKLVFGDQTVKIYELTGWRPYFSAGGCRLDVVSRATVSADCPAAAYLTRLELYLPGWRSWVNGTETPVVRVDQLFQQIALPAGHSTVEYRFRPPYMPLGYAAFAVGCLVWLCGWPPVPFQPGKGKGLRLTLGYRKISP